MKRMLIALTGLAGMALAPLNAADVFAEMASLRTSFQVHPTVRGLNIEEIDGSRGLIFRPEGSETSVLVYGPVKEAQILPIDKASVEFMVVGRGSVGLYLRGKPDVTDRSAYLALLNVGSNRKSMFRLFKHTIWPQTPPDDGLIAMQELTSIGAQNWYRLSFEIIDEPNGEATLKAVLTDVQSSEEISTLEMKDIDEVIAREGQIALRLFSESRTEGEVQLRNLMIEHP